IPLNLEAAVRNAFSAHFAVVDVGEVNGRVFVNNSGIGLYPRFVRLREEEERQGHAKPVAFLLTLLYLVRRDFHLRMKVGHRQALDQLTPFLFDGANRYTTSGLDVGTRPRLDSGRLWVCTAPKIGRRNLLSVALGTLLGRETDKALNAFEAEELWGDAGTPRVSVSTDGEVSMIGAASLPDQAPRASGSWRRPNLVERQAKLSSPAGTASAAHCARLRSGRGFNGRKKETRGDTCRRCGRIQSPRRRRRRSHAGPAQGAPQRSH